MRRRKIIDALGFVFLFVCWEVFVVVGTLALFDYHEVLFWKQLLALLALASGAALVVATRSLKFTYLGGVVGYLSLGLLVHVIDEAGWRPEVTAFSVGMLIATGVLAFVASWVLDQFSTNGNPEGT